MKLKKIFLTHLLCLSTLASGDPVISVDEESGAGAQMEKFCSAANTLYGITTSLQNVRLPNIGAGGGYSVGVIQTTNALVDFCDYYHSLLMADTTDLIFMAAEAANKADDNRHAEELDLARSTWDAAQLFYDPNSGKLRPTSAMDPVRMARGLNNYWRDLGGYYNRNVAKTPNAWDVRTRAQREADQRRLARDMEEGAALKAEISCPKPLNDENISKEYQKLLEEHEPKISKAEDLIDIYYNHLREMGFKLNYEEKSTSEYMKVLNDFRVGYVKHEATIRTFGKKTKVYRNNPKATKKNYDEPTQKQSDGKATQEYQKIRATKNPDAMKLLLDVYNPRWVTWTKAMLPGLEGRTRGVNKVEDEFKDYGVLCNEREIAEKKGLDREDPGYDYKMKDYLIECIDANDKKISSQGGLFKFYTKKMAEQLFIMKTSQSKIWTYESKHLGIFRVFESSDNGKGLEREKVTCAKSKNVARHLETAAKLAGVNASINSQIAKTQLQLKAMEEEKLKQRKRERDYLETQAVISSQKETRKSDLQDAFDDRSGVIGY